MKSNQNCSHVNVPARKVNPVLLHGDIAGVQPASLPDAKYHGVPDKKVRAGASQISDVGGMMPNERDGKKKRLNPRQKRAANFNSRSENGNANAEGGQ